MTQEARNARVAGLVSIVIPCFNPGPFLEQAIDSALSQSYPRIEVLVVDDGSTEEVQAIACRWPGVRYLRQPNRGVAIARDSSARSARSPIHPIPEGRLPTGVLDATALYRKYQLTDRAARPAQENEGALVPAGHFDTRGTVFEFDLHDRGWHGLTY